LKVLMKLVKFIFNLFNQNPQKEVIMSSIKAKNDSPRLRQELKDLKSKNPELDRLLQELLEHVSQTSGKDIVVTMILRTHSEQDAIYGGRTNSKGRRYDERPWKSPHQFWQALDLRSRIYSDEELKDMVKWLNDWGKANGNYYSWTAKVHEVGNNGMHFHVQFVKA